MELKEKASVQADYGLKEYKKNLMILKIYGVKICKLEFVKLKDVKQ